MAEAFHAAHFTEFGYRRRMEEVELVNLRVRALAPAPVPKERVRPPRRRMASPSLSQHAVLPDGERAEISVHRREELQAGHFLLGPALVIEYSATTWVAAGFVLEVQPRGILSLRRERGGES
jgi:N-methylhydantoinase A